MGFIRIFTLAWLATVAMPAAPVSNCTANSPAVGGFTCNVYPSLADGTPSEISSIFNLFDIVTAGFIVLLESPGADVTDVTQWSDVLELIDDGEGFATTGRLLSSGCNCFPSFATVDSSPSAFLVENQSGVGNDFVDFTVFQAGLNTFNIYSAAPVGAVPEPATTVLMGGGLCWLAMRRNYFKISKKALAAWLSARRTG